MKQLNNNYTFNIGYTDQIIKFNINPNDKRINNNYTYLDLYFDHNKHNNILNILNKYHGYYDFKFNTYIILSTFVYIHFSKHIYLHLDGICFDYETINKHKYLWLEILYVLTYFPNKLKLFHNKQCIINTHEIDAYMLILNAIKESINDQHCEFVQELYNEINITKIKVVTMD